MEEINRFVILARSGRFTATERCEQFGISHKTSYKHLDRYAALGLAGSQPRSHRPHHSPQRTDEAVEALILAERRLHRTWGPKKNAGGVGAQTRHRATAVVQHDCRDPAAPRPECAAPAPVKSDHVLVTPTERRSSRNT
jgi:hypothetical protein